MAFASFDRKQPAAPMGDINMVPLIDVMLVLLVIFIVTAPLLTHAVKLDLPQADARVNELKPERIEFAIDASGARYWNGEAVSRGEAAQRFATQGLRVPQPEVHLRADQSVTYRHVAETLADAARGGLTKIGFVSQAEARH
jgi:biopolymer transport protein ExbD